MNYSKITYRFHALQRMFERKIAESEVLDVLASGKVIENYPSDLPYPSCLLLGHSKGRPLHLVLATALDTGETIIITVYEPSLEFWQPGFELRRKP